MYINTKYSPHAAFRHLASFMSSNAPCDCLLKYSSTVMSPVLYF